jgi:hypothetical protein
MARLLDESECGGSAEVFQYRDYPGGDWMQTPNEHALSVLPASYIALLRGNVCTVVEKGPTSRILTVAGQHGTFPVGQPGFKQVVAPLEEAGEEEEEEEEQENEGAQQPKRSNRAIEQKSPSSSSSSSVASASPSSKRQRPCPKACVLDPLAQYSGWERTAITKAYTAPCSWRVTAIPDGHPYVPYNSREAKLLPGASYYQDAESCAIDGFNITVGQQLLVRGECGVPSQGAVDLLSRSVQQAIQKNKYQLKAIKVKKHNPPTIVQLMSQRSGVFLVELYWRRGEEKEWHVVVVDCDQRRVKCNTLGVAPFASGNIRETAKTHGEASSHWHVVTTSRVYMILQRR